MDHTSRDYHQLNSGAHRRTSLTIEAPALTCHLGFWAPEITTSDNFNRWKLAIDDSIISTLKSLRRKYGSKAVHCHSVMKGYAVLFRKLVSYDDLRDSPCSDQEILDAQDSDFRNISIEVGGDNFRLSFSYELHTEYVTVTMALELRDVDALATDETFGSACVTFKSLSKFMHGRSKWSMSCSDVLYRTFWDRVIDDHIEFSQRDNFGIGTIFADFRGTIISDETRTFRDQFMMSDPARTMPQWGDTAITDLQNVIGDVKNEITASYMLAGRALYLTNLGPQIVDEERPRHQPTKYIIYVHQKDLSIRSINIVNPWQLGRLIDRLHWLGIHRLAALRNLAELREASRRLAGLDDVVNELGPDASSRKVFERTRRYIKPISKDIIGGLQYRTERSRYYVSNFRRMVSNLRLVRVEGYQPYDVFIEQRLGAIFSFIDRLGIRYERAQKAISQRRENAFFDEIIAIQKFGEAALLVGLAPYYLSHLFAMSGLSLGYDEFCTFALWSAGIVFYLYRLSVNEEPGRGKAVLQSLLVFSGLLAAFVGMSVFRHQADGSFDRSRLDSYITLPAARHGSGEARS